MSNDILRGLRWGAILLAGLTTGLLCYRILSEPAPTTPKAKIPAAPAPEKKDGTSTNPASTTPASTKPVSPWSPTPSRIREVPPPPPIGMKITHSARIGSPSREKTETSEIILKDEGNSVAAGEISNGVSVEVADDKAADQSVEEKVDREQSVAAAVPEEIAAKSQGRGKRMLKSVGRFLHLGTHP